MRVTARDINLALIITLAVACSPSHHHTERRGVSIAYLQSMNSEWSKRITEDIYIEGYIVANDKLREVEHAAVIADNTGGIELKLESDHVERVLPLSAFVRLNCSGLNIGWEGGRPVIGLAPTEGYAVDMVSDEVLFNHIKSVDMYRGMIDAKDISIEEMTSQTALSYVKLSHLRLIAEEHGKRWCDIDSNSPSGYATSLRHFSDGRDTLRVVVHHACNYASEPIPDQSCTLTGVIDWYDGDYALRISAHRIYKE